MPAPLMIDSLAVCYGQDGNKSCVNTNRCILPFRLLSFPIGVTADDAGLPAVTAARLIAGAFGLSLPTGLACTTNMSAMKSTG